MLENDFTRLVNDVCAIFTDITGIPADPKREAGVVVPWARKGWMNNDFRLVIEYQFKDPNASKWFREHPEAMNLRGMLRESREQVLSDMLEGLKAMQQLEDKKFRDSVIPRRAMTMLMKCGARIPLGDKASYDSHMNTCFEQKGACFL